MEVIIESNIDWELVPSVDWLTVSATEGTGNAVIRVNSNGDNPTDSSRTGKIYVYKQSTLNDSIIVTQNGKRKSFRIEAEDYIDKSGTQVESTGDEGGGENVGYIDVGDWLTYNLEITYDGVYDVTFRHAGWAGDFDVSINDTVIQNITFPATADWQVWESYTTEMILTEGLHEMKLSFNSVGTNLNWYQFDWKRLANLDQTHGEEIRIFPNPANETVYIEFSACCSPGEITIYSAEGRTMIHQDSQGISGESIDVSGLEKGIYILKANLASLVVVKTLIIE